MKHIILMLSVMIIIIGCNRIDTAQQNSGTNRNTATVIRSTIVASIEEEGEITPLKSVEVKSSISGRVGRVVVNAGDFVKNGQIIAEIVADREQTRTINTIVNNFREAEINFENTKRDYEYTKDLFNNNFISERELTDVFNKYRLAQFRYDSTKEEYLLALNEIELNTEESAKTSSVISPLTGVVLERFIEVGELVSGETSARSGTILFNIADYTHFVVKVDINEFDIDRVRHNQKVDITRGRTGEERYEGKVFKISPLATQRDGVRVYPVEIEILNVNENLRFGMTAAVRIITAEAENVLTVPVSSLFVNNRRQEYVMLRQPDGSFSEHFVKRGVNNVFFVQILEGLQEGEVIMDQSTQGGAGRQARTPSTNIPGMPNPGIGIRR